MDKTTETQACANYNRLSGLCTAKHSEEFDTCRSYRFLLRSQITIPTVNKVRGKTMTHTIADTKTICAENTSGFMAKLLTGIPTVLSCPARPLIMLINSFTLLPGAILSATSVNRFSLDTKKAWDSSPFSVSFSAFRLTANGPSISP